MFSGIKDFVSYTSRLFGEERWKRYLDAFNEAPPVSIRLNPFKQKQIQDVFPVQAQQVPWCRNAYYLPSRPDFTHDPLLHAGAYYVQEASSMFLDHVLRHVADGVRTALDLCAAPGGKSTLLRAALPDGALLYSNEPDRKRANILAENMQKQGHPHVVVTNNHPLDYKKAGLKFDLILADVPCSGEGMFRKDRATIGEWSTHNVMKCQQLQRKIITDIWDCLNAGGTLVYSTCTFNTREDEENVRWIAEELGAEIISVPVNAEWNLTGSLLAGFDKPVYRFIPGTTRGEGLFMAVLRKNSLPHPLRKEGCPPPFGGVLCKQSQQAGARGGFNLRQLEDTPTVKGRKVIPPHAEALRIDTPRDKYPRVELDMDEALRYLHHESLVLPASAPRGFVIVTYDDLPLGFVNNIGNRANNLYPKEWKIRNL